MPLGQGYPQNIASMYCAKNNKAKQTIRILKDGLLCFVPLPAGLVFVTVHAIASILLLGALSTVFAPVKKKREQKP